MPTKLLINWLIYTCGVPLLSPFLVGLGLLCFRRTWITSFGRLFCDGQLCFYATTVAASTGGDLITEFGTGKYANDTWIQLSIVAMLFAFIISTFFFGLLTFAEEGNRNAPPAIWISVCLAIGATVVAGSIRWYYHLY
jgi:hypothetical protein